MRRYTMIDIGYAFLQVWLVVLSLMIIAILLAMFWYRFPYNLSLNISMKQDAVLNYNQQADYFILTLVSGQFPLIKVESVSGTLHPDL